jgi:hypothetical protein
MQTRRMPAHSSRDKDPPFRCREILLRGCGRLHIRSRRSGSTRGEVNEDLQDEIIT